MSLASLGYSPFFAAQLTASQLPARVIAPRGERFLVHDGSREFLADIRGTLREDPLFPPAVGDWVLLDPTATEPVIYGILERRTSISRKRPGRPLAPQILAANIDRVLVVMALDQDFSLTRLERYLTLVWDSGATPIVVLSKSDLASDLAGQLRQVETRALGFPVIALNNLSGDGLAEVERELHSGQTVVLLGSSGVGKSTLINRLAGSELRRTSAVRAEDGKGRHTSSDRQLFRLPTGALVIDTPGLREVQLWAGEESLDQTFAEIADFATSCRFTDCTHESEPGCAVQQAIESGVLDPDRLASYRQLRGEIDYLNRQADPGASQQYKSRMKELMRAQRSFYKHSDKRRE